jgi:TRAP-type mannitol/chloroaromatic compound transport system permease small subunit
LLAAQGVSELIKRVAFLKGVGPDALSSHQDAPCEATEQVKVSAAHQPIGER